MTSRTVPLLQRPIRSQVSLDVSPTLDELIPTDPPARRIWNFIEALDMTPFERTIASNVDTGGRPAVDPRILLALWVYATTKGETRAAEIAELCQMHKAYQWICGGVHGAEHTLSDFRVDHEEALEATHQQIVELAIGEGLVDPSVTAQDGTRIRASAGTGSFRRLSSLRQEREQVMRAVDKAEAAARDPRRSKVARAAAIRGAKDRLDRIEGAIERAQEIVEDKHLSEPQADDKKRAPRVSTTDPEATVMKMGDGGFRPAYNVQFATAADGSGVILGVDVTMRGSDQGEMAPMLVQPRAADGSGAGAPFGRRGLRVTRCHRGCCRGGNDGLCTAAEQAC